MRLLSLVMILLAGPALANDGFGGLTATGLTFGHTGAVAMEQEELFISPDRIVVDYVFHNAGAQDVEGEVIFPLPPISLPALENEEWNLPADVTRDNLVNFTATVDGAPVAVAIDRRAVLEPDDAWERPATAQYDAPGLDVTAALVAAGIPLTLDLEALHARLDALDPAARKALLAQGLVGAMDAEDPAEGLFPLWSIVLRYHWQQRFPAGARVKISHSYENRPAGGFFVWEDPPGDYGQEVQKQYCIDAATSKAIARAITARQSDGMAQALGTSLNIAYVLRTATSWAGPIGRFRLTLDKGDVRNVVSLCASGVAKTGPTTFVMEKTDFAPDRDLEILIVRPVLP